MFKKYSLLLISLLSFALLTGCGEKEELTTFKENMNTFYTEISAIGSSIDAIDPEAENAVSDLMDNLNEMSAQFLVLADMEVPEEFSSIENLADDAYEYMAEAVSLYSQAYSEDSVNTSYVEAASANYENAIKRVNYIASLLQGEIPEGATVITGEGNEFEPYTE